MAEASEAVRVMEKFNSQYAETMIGLMERWRDEQEYEDFAEYLALMKKMVTDFTVVSMTKRPFGITIKSGDKSYYLKYQAAGRYVRTFVKPA